jgi:pimeloyl-ACP methyl ester carboxylesterase
MAYGAEAVAREAGLSRYVLVGHSMGGKVAQIVAARRPEALAGVVLVAPAPPTPMPVPEEQRAAMLVSYSSREGVEQALSVLAGAPLSPELREQVIDDTLRGAPGAKRAWTERGMIEDVSAGLVAVTVLHIRLVPRPLVHPHHQRDGRHSFAPNDADLQLMLAVGDDRGDAALGEVDVLDGPVARMQLLANGKVNGFEVAFEQAQVGAR